MNTEALIIALAAAVAIAVVAWFILWIRGARQAALEAISKKMRRGRQKKLLGPMGGSYSGAQHTYGKVRGNGLMGLTDRCLYFHKLVGKPLEIEIDTVQSVTEEKWFMGHRTGGLPHMVLELKDQNRIGFQLRRWQPWIEAIQGLLDKRK